MTGWVLVVLPVTFLRKVVEDILTNYFENITLVSTAKEALELVKGLKAPDLIISSYILEDGNVFNLLQGLEQSQKLKIPVVLLTSEENPELMEKALKKGVVEVVLKKELVEKLPRFLRDFTKVIQIKNLEGNILYLEDAKLHIEFLINLFSETRLKILPFRRMEEAWECFKENDLDLVIVDLILSDGMSGLDFVRKIREHNEKGEIPIIVLTAYDNPARKVELFKAGADDFITKPPLKEELFVKVFNYITKKKSIDQLKEKLNKLKNIYMKDPLTGLYNRNVMEEFLRKELERANRYRYDIGFIMADLDNFKQINDNFGHLTGDKVLKHFAEIVLSSIRSSDYAIRYGGEEFLVALIHTDSKQAFAKAEDLRRKLESSSVEGMKITASFGVTSLNRHPGKSLEEIIKIVDQALYAAKFSGKNRVEAN